MSAVIPQEVYDIIRWSEGCRLQAYRNPGDVPTIGWGHTQGVHLGMTCTQAQADAWLYADVQEAAHLVDGYVKVDLTINQRGALASFVFALGIGRLLESTLLDLLNKGGYDAVPHQLLLWDKVNGVPNARLEQRRMKEAALWRKPL